MTGHRTPGAADPDGRGTRALLILVAITALAWPGSLHALEARIRELRTIGDSLRASVDLRDMLSDTLRRVLESGGPLHVRVQAELWEDRPVWDKLVRPALVSVFRVVRDPGTSRIAVTDAVGTILSFAQWPDPLTLKVEVAPAQALQADNRYYLRIVATIGTIAERDIQTGEAVFGRDDGSIGLGSVGRLVFRTVLQATDYLQSVSTEAQSDRFHGRDVRR
jgi:hypothetical protein